MKVRKCWLLMLVGCLVLGSVQVRADDDDTWGDNAWGDDELQPLAAMAQLIREIVPEERWARPPYLPARYDRGLLPGKEATLEKLLELAVTRQSRLEELWEQAAAAEPTTAGEVADLDLLRYAFTGEGEAEAWESAQEAGFAAGLRLARLQLAENRFDAAVRKLIALADSDDPRNLEALVLLVQHATDRGLLSTRAQLLPLSVDLDAYLKRRAAAEPAATIIKTITQRCSTREIPVRKTREEMLWEIDPEIIEIGAAGRQGFLSGTS